MFKYLYDGKQHTDISADYMDKLGLDDDTQESILNQKSYEESEQLVLDKRARAYRKESDPLFIEASFDNDETAMQQWRDKVTEIKERFPK